MKNSRKVWWVLALALMVSLSLAALVWAQPMGMMKGHGPRHMMKLTTEQAGKLFDLKEKFRSDTVNLRKSLLIKRLEMRDLWRAANPDEKAILAKLKEIAPLREQMMEKRVAFRLEARKIAPQAAFCGMGPHHGFGMGMGEGFGMGRGMGMGPGRMGPGMGMGPGPMAPGQPTPPPTAPPAKK
jgi:Spy/CpxP family protein refolding chaperone